MPWKHEARMGDRVTAKKYRSGSVETVVGVVQGIDSYGEKLALRLPTHAVNVVSHFDVIQIERAGTF